MATRVSKERVSEGGPWGVISPALQEVSLGGKSGTKRRGQRIKVGIPKLAWQWPYKEIESCYLLSRKYIKGDGHEWIIATSYSIIYLTGFASDQLHPCSVTPQNGSYELPSSPNGITWTKISTQVFLKFWWVKPVTWWSCSLSRQIKGVMEESRVSYKCDHLIFFFSDICSSLASEFYISWSIQMAFFHGHHHAICTPRNITYAKEDYSAEHHDSIAVTSKGKSPVSLSLVCIKKWGVQTHLPPCFMRA